MASVRGPNRWMIDHLRRVGRKKMVPQNTKTKGKERKGSTCDHMIFLNLTPPMCSPSIYNQYHWHGCHVESFIHRPHLEPREKIKKLKKNFPYSFLFLINGGDGNGECWCFQEGNKSRRDCAWDLVVLGIWGSMWSESPNPFVFYALHHVFIFFFLLFFLIPKFSWISIILYFVLHICIC